MAGHKYSSEEESRLFSGDPEPPLWDQPEESESTPQGEESQEETNDSKEKGDASRGEEGKGGSESPGWVPPGAVPPEELKTVLRALGRAIVAAGEPGGGPSDGEKDGARAPSEAQQRAATAAAEEVVLSEGSSRVFAFLRALGDTLGHDLLGRADESLAPMMRQTIREEEGSSPRRESGTPPPEELFGRPAAEVLSGRLPNRAKNGLVSVYNEPPTKDYLSERLFATEAAAANRPGDRKPLTLLQLARDFQACPGMFEDVPGVGPETVGNIREALSETGALDRAISKSVIRALQETES